MRLSCLLAISISSTALHVLGSPAPSVDQVVLSGLKAAFPSSESKWDATSSDFLSDAKQVILKGKENMQKWYHDGKEFLKQNGLLCEYTRLDSVRVTEITVNMTR